MFENNQSIGRGGKRAGSGRKRGSATQRTREIADRAAASGEQTPLEYMLEVLRNVNEAPAIRLDAAKSAAPYMHPRLSAVEVSGELGVTVDWPITPPPIGA